MKFFTFFIVSFFFFAVVFTSPTIQAEEITLQTMANSTKAISPIYNSTQGIGQSTSSPKDSSLPEYTMQIIQKKPKVFLGIYCTISAPIDERTLEQLGNDCFEKVHGKSYTNTFINWYIEGTEKRGKPWGITNYRSGDPEVKIFSTK